MTEKKKSYARSEVHLTDILETVCQEMKNYSGFTEDLPDGGKRTVYHRCVRACVRAVLLAANCAMSRKRTKIDSSGRGAMLSRS
jgi:hypothetical protein